MLLIVRFCVAIAITADFQIGCICCYAPKCDPLWWCHAAGVSGCSTCRGKAEGRGSSVRSYLLAAIHSLSVGIAQIHWRVSWNTLAVGNRTESPNGSKVGCRWVKRAHELKSSFHDVPAYCIDCKAVLHGCARSAKSLELTCIAKGPPQHKNNQACTSCSKGERSA
eukprot:4117315-Amphidinium_carterae.1